MLKFAGMFAAAVAMGGSALAADLPSGPPPSPIFTPVSAFSWTGFYVGVNAGAVWNASKWSDPARPIGFAPFSTDGSSYLVGVQLGYNYQLGNNIVLGAEETIQLTGVAGRGQCGALVGSICQTSQRLVSGYHAKLGFAFDRFMVYGLGGFALTGYQFRQIGPISQNWGSNRRVGWTIGLGADYAINDHWIAGLQYRFMHFGSKVGPGGPLPPSIIFRETENAVTASISYKF